MVVVVSMREPLHRSTLYTADTSDMMHFYLFLDFGVVLSSYSFVKLFLSSSTSGRSSSGSQQKLEPDDRTTSGPSFLCSCLTITNVCIRQRTFGLFDGLNRGHEACILIIAGYLGRIPLFPAFVSLALFTDVM